MNEHDRGQVESSAAEIYDALFVPSLFGRFARDIADLANVGSEDSVIDVACGTGALTRALRARTSGRLVGVDINPAMLSVARTRGGDIEYRENDAAALSAADNEFEVACSQFGLMFFEDPTGAVAEMRRVSSRGLVAVWDSIERSDGYVALQELFEAELGTDAAASLDAPFTMGRAGVLEKIVVDAGIDQVDIVSIEGSGRFDSIEQWVTTEVRGWTLGDSITDGELADLAAVANANLARFASDEGCVFGLTARVATWND